MLRGERIEPVDCVPERASIADVFPSQRGQACCKKYMLASAQIACVDVRGGYCGSGIIFFWTGCLVRLDLLHNGVIGVLMGLTRTLSRWSWKRQC